MAPSTWNHRLSRSARSAMASRSSSAPVLIVPALRDDGEGLEAGGAVGRDHRGEGVEVDREVGGDGDQAQGVGAEAEQLAALAVAAVHLGGGVDGEPPAVRHPVGAQARADAGDPGDREPDEVGLRRPGDEQPAGVGRVAGGLGAPAHDLLLDEDRRVVGAAEVGVEHAGEEVGEVADRVAGAHVPAPETGVVVAHRVGDDVAEEVVVRRRHALGPAGERGVEDGAHVVGHGAPDGLVPATGEVVEGVVDHAVGEDAQGVPVLGVQAGAAVGRWVGVGRRRHPRIVPLRRGGDQRGVPVPVPVSVLVSVAGAGRRTGAVAKLWAPVARRGADGPGGQVTVGRCRSPREVVHRPAVWGGWRMPWVGRADSRGGAGRGAMRGAGWMPWVGRADSRGGASSRSVRGPGPGPVGGR